jgi:diaminopimelate decarboxylase
MAEKKKYERPVVTKLQSGIMNKFGSGPAVSVLETIDGVAVSTLVEQYGSPLFVLSERTIRTNQRNAYRVFKNRYPEVQFAWSYKTNYLNAVCQVFHQEGSWAEVVSEFEYDKARALGIPGEHILFNGPDKSVRALTKAIREGAKIHIDHFDELYSIAEITEKQAMNANVAIRVNMDVGVYPQWDRFGFNYENGEAWQAIRRIAANKRMRFVGLHTHIGTYMMSAEAYRIAATKLATLAKSMRDELDLSVEYIDLGGGFASNNTLIGQYLPAEEVIPSIEQYADAIVAGLLRSAFKPDELPTLILETGRGLIDDAGFLVTSVLANKRLSTGRRAIIVDAGVNLLFTSFWYKHKISPAQPVSVHTEDAVVYGPLCMNIDVIRDGVLLPTLKPGDKLVLHRVGAYNMTQWMQFITLRPNIVMVMENGAVELVRKAETLEYLLDREVLPAKLAPQKP